jgi:ubiquitin-conjugating enzyme E2 Q
LFALIVQDPAETDDQFVDLFLVVPNLYEPSDPSSNARQPGQLNATVAPPPAAPLVNDGPLDEFREASYYVYDRYFDELEDEEKQKAICAMLDLLPAVSQMQKYLARKAQSPLSSWVDRLPLAVLSILRWIIASNRACILQVADEGEEGAEDRVYGMPGWTQFRFAMGAPDKELRFLNAVRQTSERLHLKFPTLFAWHGSPLWNWHAIIREGLKFTYTANGRAFGNGVYCSQDLNTSIGYSQQGGSGWMSSELKVGLVSLIPLPCPKRAGRDLLVETWGETDANFVARLSQ